MTNSLGNSIADVLVGRGKPGGGGGMFGSVLGFFGLPSFAVGTSYVPREMVAQIHKGERIVPANQNRPGTGGVTLNSVVNIRSGGKAADTHTVVQKTLDARDRAWSEQLRQIGVL